MGTSGGIVVERKLTVSGEATVVADASGGSVSVSIGGISPTGGEDRPGARTIRPPIHRSGGVTRRANRGAMRVARSL